MAGVDIEAIGRSAALSAQRMSGPQKLTLALAFIATAAGMFAIARVTSSTPMSTLYADLDPDSAASVVSELDSRGVPYELDAGGRVVRVPSDEVHSLRLSLSSEGLPNGSTGWSVLEDQGLTTSAFDQRVGYQRAMQGELARTIASIDGVSEASVHLVIPEHDFLTEDDRVASASVLVDTGGRALSPMQVDAVVNLVASAVEGLTPDQVSVADETGRVLAAPGQGDGVVGLEGDNQLRAKQSYEATLEADLEQMLAAVVGPGMALVTVEAELDFDSVVTVTEQYQPTQTEDGDQMLIAETTRNEQYRDGDAEVDVEEPLDIEVPEGEEAPEVEEGEAAGTGVDYSLDERDATYAVDKVVTNAENAVGEVVSLSVSVLVDENAVDAARVAEIEEMVSAAAGLDPARGDGLAVTLMPLDEGFIEAVEAGAAAEGTSAGGLDIFGLIRMVLASLIGVVVILLGLRYLARGSRQAAEVTEIVDYELVDPARAALPEGGDDDEPGEPADVRLQGLIENQSDDVAGVLRTWLNEDEAAVR